MVWKAGAVYRHRHEPSRLVHVLGTIHSSLYGEVFVGETADGAFLPLPEYERVNWVEAQRNEWDGIGVLLSAGLQHGDG